MPTVPIPQQRVAPAAIPQVRTPTQAPVEAFGQTRGIDLSGAADSVAAQALDAKKQADQIAVTEAATKYSLAKNKRLYDPQTGVLNTKGKDAFGVPEVVDAWQQNAVYEIGSGLANDYQRMLFQRMADTEYVDVSLQVQRHIANERQQYDTTTTNALIETKRNEALTGFRDPRNVQMSIAYQEAAIIDHGKRNGMPDEWVAQQVAKAKSATRAGVVEQFVVAGEDLRAQEYFDRHKDELQGDDLLRTEKMVNVASTDGKASRIVDQTWATLGPKSLNDPVRVETLETEIRKQAGDNTKVAQAGVQELRSRAAAHNAEQTEVKAQNLATVWTAFNAGKGLPSITKMPAYFALTGTEQAQVKSAITGELEQRDNRAFNMSQRAEVIKTQKGFATYWEYQDPKKLATMTDAQVLALQPEIGRELVNNLMTQRRSVTKNEEAIRAATIDQDQFNTIADAAGLKPYESRASAETKATLGQVKNAVENEIAKQQSVKGKVLTRDEKAAVMHGIVDNQVMITEWGRDPSKIAITVTAKERADAYVPIATIRQREAAKMSAAGATGPDFVAQAVSWMRKNNVVANVTATDEQIVKAMGDRIEKAYAARQLGADAAAIQNILKGTP